ncbi:MAG: AsnC family transcriptional regulator [Proteobacteria bacterium]|nr:AsnC family transcriptional regulator [Pseudomonadota bacterium]
MHSIDETDKRIINRIQSNFPICLRPYHVIAQELNLDESDVIDRIQRLKKIGIIRRIGGNFSPEKLGFFSTLCAAKVSSDKIDAFADVVNSYPGVTHNYVRENSYNVWFTFIAPSRDDIESSLLEIKDRTGIETINLPATRVFKISAQFKL